MKKTMQNLTWLLTIPLLLTFVNTGCQSTPERVALNVSGSIIYTVEAAMRSWADAVHQGLVTREQEYEVEFRYNQYLLAKGSVKQALLSWIDRPEQGPMFDAAIEALQSAEGKLIELINTFLETKRTVPTLSNPPLPK